MNGFSEAFVVAAELVSQWTIPGVILLIVLAAWWRSVPMYESFITGAKEGFGVVVMIIPYLVAILFAIKLFLASGVFEDLKWVATKGLEALGLERFAQTFELLPLALTKPLSGGASRGVLVDLFDRFGADSFIGNTGSIMMGSSETTFYILSVYFGSIGVKKFRHTLPACLIADAAGFAAAITLGWMFFA